MGAAIDVDVVTVRVRERHTPRGLTHRNGDLLTVAQRQHQSTVARRVVHRRRQGDRVPFRHRRVVQAHRAGVDRVVHHRGYRRTINRQILEYA